jgi:putative transposase
MECGKNMECGGLPPLFKAELAPHAVEAGLGKQGTGLSAQSKTPNRWHHRPAHVFEPNQLYMVTASTLHKELLFHGDERLSMLQQRLFSLSEKFKWKLQAWALFPSHYHFIAKAPKHAETLKPLVRQLHSLSARQLNQMDHLSGRKVWFQYWDTCLTYEKSYYARLNYVMNNPVHHGLVHTASAYRFCSAGWFETEAEQGFVNKVKSYKYDQVKVQDEF